MEQIQNNGGTLNMSNILILVDMQNGFCKYEHSDKLILQIENLLKLNIFDYIIATKFLNHEGSMYTKLFDWHDLISEDDRSICDKLNNYWDILIEKSIYTCVDNSFIDILKRLNDDSIPEKIFVAGLDTDCCVLKIATDLFENGIRPVVLTKYCDSNGGPEYHLAGIMCLQRLIGEKQLYNEEILSKEDLYKI